MSDSRPKLFLSYARGDDEPFVKRLYERLAAEGFSVWWDRQCMPSRALTFLKEIRDAVRAADRTVVVIGPKCVSSDYCRAEWQAALAESKIVTPLLRLGDHTQLPPELARFHCPNFCDEPKFEEAFRETVRVLTEAVPPLGALLGGVPDVPPHFQPRPDDLSALAARILIDETKPVTLTGGQRVTVLHGMGGTGKSVLAATFARSTSTRRSFADGLLWLDVGERATSLALTAELGRLLGDPPSAHTDLGTSKSRLTKSLAPRSALLVLDNVWSVEQIEPFIEVLGPSGRILITSRLGELATATGGNTIELGMLSPMAAVQHLADWSAVEPDALLAAAHDVARECGYLPFALALNGAMHQQGVPWADLLEALRASELDYAEQRLKGYPYPTVLKSIKVSMDALDANDAVAGARLRELAAFHPGAGIPEAAIAVLWSHTAGLAKRHVSKVLTQLAGKALIRLDGELPARRAFLHDLQRDYLARVTDPSTLNTTLLSAYENACGGEWPRLPVDGYIQQNLIEHLLAAGRKDTAHALLNQSTPGGGNAWFETNVAIDNVIGYLADLDRLDPGGADEPLALHLALIRVSVETSLRRIPARVHVALLGAGRTTGANALASMRRIEDPEKRVSAILALVPELADAEREQALAECLATVRSRAADVKAKYLPEIARHFAGNERAALADEALRASRALEIPEYRAEGLGAVLRILDEPLRSEVAAEAAPALEESVSAASFREAASAVLPHVPGLAASLLDRVRAIGEPFLTAMAFEAIVPHLPPNDRPAAAREGIAFFEAARANGLWIVVSLARHIPGFDLNGLIQRAATQDQRQVPALVDALPQMLSGATLQSALQAVAAAAETFEEPSRTKTKIELLRHYEAPRREAEVLAMLRDTPALPYDSWRRDAYVGLLDHLQRDQLIEVGKRMARIEDECEVLAAAAELSRHGDAALRGELLTRINALPASREKFVALVALAQNPQDPHHPLAIEAASALCDEVPRWQRMSRPMVALIPLLPPNERNKMLEAACNSALQGGGFVAEDEFIKLLPVLPEAAIANGFRRLLEDAERLSHHRQQYWASGPQESDNSFALADTLARIAPHLPGTLAAEALAAVNRMTDQRWRSVALCHLWPHLEPLPREKVLPEILRLAPAADADEQFRVAACRGLGRAIPALDGDAQSSLRACLREALSSIGAGWLPGLMKDVASALVPDELEELVERAIAQPNLFTPLAVSNFVSPPQRWSFCLAALERVSLERSADATIVDLLNSTVEALLKAPDDVRLKAWESSCQRLRGDRSAVATSLAALAPLAASVQRGPLLGAVARSLMATQGWWP